MDSWGWFPVLPVGREIEEKATKILRRKKAKRSGHWIHLLVITGSAAHPPPPDSAEDLRTVPPSAASEGKHWVSVLILWKRVWSQVSGPWPLDAGQWGKHHSSCLGLLMARVGFSHLWPWRIKEEFNTDLLSPIDDFKELLALEVFQQVCV